MGVLTLLEARNSVERLLLRLGLKLVELPVGADIPGSFWGEPEAGLIGDRLYARPDTPVHSILHETCHYVCMDERRRVQLHSNAGGTHGEENAVCYLQLLLAEQIPEMGRERMFRDMDAWGYSFRLGSSRRWFEEDAQEARQVLVDWGLIDTGEHPTFRLRGSNSETGASPADHAEALGARSA